MLCKLKPFHGCGDIRVGATQKGNYRIVLHLELVFISNSIGYLIVFKKSRLSQNQNDSCTKWVPPPPGQFF